MLYAKDNMAAKPGDQLTRLSQTWKHFEYWWYRQKLSLNWAFVLEKKIFKHYFTAFIGFSQKSRWLPYRALVQNAFLKHASALPNDDLSEISAHMGCWFWRRRFLLIKLNIFENPIWRPRSRDRTRFYCQITQVREHACYARNFKLPRPLGLEKKPF